MSSERYNCCFGGFFLEMRGMMKRPRGTSQLSLLIVRVQFSDTPSAIFSETNKSKRRKNYIRMIRHHYSKFLPFLPLCVFLSLSLLLPWHNNKTVVGKIT